MYSCIAYSPYDILPKNLAMKIPAKKTLPLPIAVPKIAQKESLTSLLILIVFKS